LVNKLLEPRNDFGKSKFLFQLSDIRKVKINKFKIIFMLILWAFDVSASHVIADSDLILYCQYIIRVSTYLIKLVIQGTRIRYFDSSKLYNVKISSLARLSFRDFLIFEVLIELVWKAFVYWSYSNDVVFFESTYSSYESS